MNRLVNDMLELSKYEAGAYALERQPFDVRGFMEEGIANFGILAQEKGTALRINAPEKLIGYAETNWRDVPGTFFA